MNWDKAQGILQFSITSLIDLKCMAMKNKSDTNTLYFFSIAFIITKTFSFKVISRVPDVCDTITKSTALVLFLCALFERA
jgi:hypothetical protein